MSRISRDMQRPKFVFVIALALLAALGNMGCSGAHRAEGLDIATLPTSLRADYEVFAVRCSKCHSLARPLQSGISDDEYWKKYVERMRRQPGSGISRADTQPILRFLHYFSETQARKGSPLPTPAAGEGS